jgi:cell shape-determining protein MreC
MSIIDIVKRFGQNKEEFKRKFKEAQEEQRIEEIIKNRAKSSNQRELERFYKEQEEKRIKDELDIIRKRRNKENWKGKSILTKGASILKDERPILKEKCIFKNNKSMFLRAGGFI